MNNNQEKRAILPIILLCVVLGALFVILFLLFTDNKSTIINEGDLTERQDAVVCSINSNIESPFYYAEASKVSHTIKIMVNDNKLDSFFYEYKGQFASDSAAEGAMTNAHAGYDVYLGENEVSDKPESHFNYFDKSGNITLYADLKQINIYTGKYFFLEDVMANNIKARNEGEIIKYYEDLGFSCKTNQ